MKQILDRMPQPLAVWLPLLLLPLVVPIATTNLTMFGADPLTADSLQAIKAFLLFALALACFAAWSLISSREDRPAFWHPSIWAAVAVLLLAVLSTLTAFNIRTAFFGGYEYRQGLLAIVTLAAVGFVVVQLRPDEAGERMLTVAVALGALPVAAYALIQVAGLDTASWADSWAIARGFSTIGNPDTLGGYLVVPAVLALGLAMSASTVARRMAWWAAFAVLSSALLLTQVRGAWLGLIIALGLLIAFAIRRRTRLTTPDWIALALVLAVLAGGAVVARESIGARVADLFAGGDTANERIALWRTGLDVASLNPLVGTGPDSLVYGYYQVRSNQHELFGGRLTLAGDAHNVLIQTAATLGYPAALALVVFLGWLLVGAFRRSFRGTPDGAAAGDEASPSGLTYGAWTAATVSYLAYAAVGPTVVAGNLVFVLGLAVLLSRQTVVISASKGVRMSLTAGALAVALIGTVTAAATLSAEAAHLRARTAVSDSAAVSAAEDAISRSPWTYEYRLLRAQLLGQIAEEADEGDVQEAAQAAMAAYEDVIAFAPAEYMTYFRYASTLLALPELGEQGSARALVMAEEALRIYPNALDARKVGAVAALRIGRVDVAIELLEDHWASDPAYPDAAVTYGYALISAGEPEAANEVLVWLEERHSDYEPFEELARAVADARAEVK